MNASIQTLKDWMDHAGLKAVSLPRTVWLSTGLGNARKKHPVITHIWNPIMLGERPDDTQGSEMGDRTDIGPRRVGRVSTIIGCDAAELKQLTTLAMVSYVNNARRHDEQRMARDYASIVGRNWVRDEDMNLLRCESIWMHKRNPPHASDILDALKGTPVDGREMQQVFDHCVRVMLSTPEEEDYVDQIQAMFILLGTRARLSVFFPYRTNS